jgi:excisionase family DNA binding protein
VPEVQWLSADEAASILGVSARRVRQLLEAGDLEAEQVGGRALLHADSVRRRSQQQPRSGRPLSPELAWAVIAALSLSPADSAALRSVVADRQLRHRLVRQLRTSHSVDEWRLLLRRRAEAQHYFAHPSVLEDLLADRLVSIGRARAAAGHGLDVSPGDDAFAYVARRHLSGLVESFALEADLNGNLELLIYDDASAAGLEPGKPVPIAAAVFDMLDSGDTRMQHQAQLWLDSAFRRVSSDLGATDVGATRD